MIEQGNQDEAPEPKQALAELLNRVCKFNVGQIVRLAVEAEQEDSQPDDRFRKPYSRVVITEQICARCSGGGVQILYAIRLFAGTAMSIGNFHECELAPLPERHAAPSTD
jgi:hypothetical protein